MESRPLILSTRKSSFDETNIESKWDTKSTRSESEPVSVKYTRRIGWPFAVVVGQILLLAVSLGLFSAVRARGYIPLPPTLADFVQQNPQSKTYGVTFLSTALSTFSSYLFSQAIRQMISVYLTNPMTVSTLRFGISVSSRSLLFDFQNIKGFLTTGVFFLATLGQTASWSSLLTPNDITVYTPLQGTELDFSSEALVSQFSQLLADPYGGYWYIDSTLLSIIDTSGATSAMSRVGYPTVLDYAGLAYNGSTGGIFPIIFKPDAPIANRTDFVTFNTMPFPPGTNSYNISMSQQGLTAAVTCQAGQLNATSDPPFQRFASQAEIVIGDKPYNYTAFWIKSTCSGAPQYSCETTSFETHGPFLELTGFSAENSVSYLSGTNDTLIAMACDSSEGTYTVIIDAQGMYERMGTMMCTVSPQIQNVTAHYNGQFVYTEPDLAYPPINSLLNVTGFSMGLVEGIINGQGQTRSSIGDALASIYGDQITGHQQVDYVTLWEAYIRGVVEFIGTAMKVILAANIGPLQGQPPRNMMKSINGTAITTTLGWQYKEQAAFAVLIPSTFVAISSIIIVLFTQFRRRGIPVEHAAFDPSNPLVLMAAASAGGMGNTFDGLTKEDVKEGQRKKVKLGQVGRRVGFVQVV